MNIPTVAAFVVTKRSLPSFAPPPSARRGTSSASSAGAVPVAQPTLSRDLRDLGPREDATGLRGAGRRPGPLLPGAAARRAAGARAARLRALGAAGGEPWWCSRRRRRRPRRWRGPSTRRRFRTSVGAIAGDDTIFIATRDAGRPRPRPPAHGGAHASGAAGGGVMNATHLMEITERPGMVFVRGEGAWLVDHTGKRYLDFVQGWAVNCLGHCPAAVVDALAAQARTLITPSPAFHNEPARRLAETIARHSDFGRVLLHQLGRRGQRGRHQARPQVGPALQGRRARDRHVRRRLPRAHARHDVGERQAGLGHDVRPPGAGISPARR